MRLASDLESFVLACAIRVGENVNADHAPDEQYPSWDITIPALSDYPLEVEGWRHLDRLLADRCLRLRNQMACSRTFIGVTAEYSEDELGDEAIEQVSKLGVEAWSIAVALRQQYKLGRVDTDGWDYPESLRNAFEAAKSRRAELRLQQARLWAEIEPRGDNTNV